MNGSDVTCRIVTLARARKRRESRQASGLHSCSRMPTPKHEKPTLPPTRGELDALSQFESDVRTVGDFYAVALNVGRLVLRKR